MVVLPRGGTRGTERPWVTGVHGLGGPEDRCAQGGARRGSRTRICCTDDRHSRAWWAALACGGLERGPVVRPNVGRRRPQAVGSTQRTGPQSGTLLLCGEASPLRISHLGGSHPEKAPSGSPGTPATGHSVSPLWAPTWDLGGWRAEGTWVGSGVCRKGSGGGSGVALAPGQAGCHQSRRRQLCAARTGSPPPLPCPPPRPQQEVGRAS